MKYATLFLVVGCFTFMNSTAQADVTIKGYREAKAQGGNKWEVIKLYLQGVGEGVVAMDIIANADRTKLICQPDNLSLNKDNYVDIIDGQLRNSHFKDDQPVTLILLFGLIETFPCNDKKNQ